MVTFIERENNQGEQAWRRGPLHQRATNGNRECRGISNHPSERACRARQRTNYSGTKLNCQQSVISGRALCQVHHNAVHDDSWHCAPKKLLWAHNRVDIWTYRRCFPSGDAGAAHGGQASSEDDGEIISVFSKIG